MVILVGVGQHGTDRECVCIEQKFPIILHVDESRNVLEQDEVYFKSNAHKMKLQKVGSLTRLSWLTRPF